MGLFFEQELERVLREFRHPGRIEPGIDHYLDNQTTNRNQNNEYLRELGKQCWLRAKKGQEQVAQQYQQYCQLNDDVMYQIRANARKSGLAYDYDPYESEGHQDQNHALRAICDSLRLMMNSCNRMLLHLDHMELKDAGPGIRTILKEFLQAAYRWKSQYKKSIAFIDEAKTHLSPENAAHRLIKKRLPKLLDEIRQLGEYYGYLAHSFGHYITKTRKYRPE